MGGTEAFFESVEAQAKNLQEWKGELVGDYQLCFNGTSQIRACANPLCLMSIRYHPVL